VLTCARPLRPSSTRYSVLPLLPRLVMRPAPEDAACLPPPLTASAIHNITVHDSCRRTAVRREPRGRFVIISYHTHARTRTSSCIHVVIIIIIIRLAASSLSPGAAEVYFSRSASVFQTPQQQLQPPKYQQSSTRLRSLRPIASCWLPQSFPT